MRQTLCALGVFIVILAFGCAEKAEKKSPPKPQAAAPTETQAHVSGGSLNAHVSGAPASPQPATEGTAHVSGN